MDARKQGPLAGMVVLCATLWMPSAVILAQYGPGPGYGQPMVGQPMMGQPAPGGMSSQPMIMRSGAMQGRGLRSVPTGMIQAASADPASMQPRLPLEGTSRGSMQAGAIPPRNQPTANGQPGQSENFIVLCHDPDLAVAVSKAAERLRRELAVHWLGQELPTWSRRCPITVKSGQRLGAAGETRFVLVNGNVGDWEMSVQGTPERILDSVLPHEITHTILASHLAPLNVHVPRWADEGACTTVEHSSEQNKHKSMLVDFMRNGRAISFNRMFSLTDYPKDILPLYAQGHSVVEFLIAQSGPQAFVKFIEQGMQSSNWEQSVREHYGYETLGALQIQWNQWIADGRGAVDAFVGRPAAGKPVGSLASNVPPSSARVNAGSPQTVQEGAAVSLAGFTNIASPTGKIPELNLMASNAETPVIAAQPKSVQTGDEAATVDQDGFYRKRLESNLRSITRTHTAPAANTTRSETTLDASLRTSGSVLR